MRVALAGCFVAAALSLAGSAGATSVDSIGDTFSVQFDGNVATQTLPGLSAFATFTVTSFDAATGQVVLSIALQNTTDSSIWQSARVSALGFDVAPTATSASASGLFSYAVLGGQFPNQFGPVDVCAINNRNNCSGGGNGGLLIGQNGTITMSLSFGGPITTIDFTNFGVRYQSLSSQSLGLTGASGTGRGTPPVPEPASAALFALGVGIVGAALRKRSA